MIEFSAIAGHCVVGLCWQLLLCFGGDYVVAIVAIVGHYGHCWPLLLYLVVATVGQCGHCCCILLAVVAAFCWPLLASVAFLKQLFSRRQA